MQDADQQRNGAYVLALKKFIIMKSVIMIRMMGNTCSKEIAVDEKRGRPVSCMKRKRGASVPRFGRVAHT